MKNLLLLLLSFCLLSSCENKSQLLGSWSIYNISNKNEADKPKDEMLYEANVQSGAKDGSIISFFKDGIFTKVDGTGAYKTGTWNYTKGKIELMTSSGYKQSASARFKTVADHQMLILSTNERELQYLRDGLPLKKETENPYHPSNNLWRIRPKKEETTAQLQERLANYFRHIAYILKASKRQSGIVSFEFSMGIVKIYNGGIGITPIEYVPENWFNTWFDKAQALAVYKMYEDYLKVSSYKGGGRWIEDDYRILIGIYADLKKGKFPVPDGRH